MALPDLAGVLLPELGKLNRQITERHRDWNHRRDRHQEREERLVAVSTWGHRSGLPVADLRLSFFKPSFEG